MPAPCSMTRQHRYAPLHQPCSSGWRIIRRGMFRRHLTDRWCCSIIFLRAPVRSFGVVDEVARVSWMFSMRELRSRTVRRGATASPNRSGSLAAATAASLRSHQPEASRNWPSGCDGRQWRSGDGNARLIKSIREKKQNKKIFPPASPCVRPLRAAMWRDGGKLCSRAFPKTNCWRELHRRQLALGVEWIETRLLASVHAPIRGSRCSSAQDRGRWTLAPSTPT